MNLIEYLKSIEKRDNNFDKNIEIYFNKKDFAICSGEERKFSKTGQFAIDIRYVSDLKLYLLKSVLKENLLKVINQYKSDRFLGRHLEEDNYLKEKPIIQTVKNQFNNLKDDMNTVIKWFFELYKDIDFDIDWENDLVSVIDMPCIPIQLKIPQYLTDIMNLQKWGVI